MKTMGGGVAASMYAAGAASAQDKASGEKSRKEVRNVLVYVVDDQGTNDAGCYGNPVIKTPGLDHLAKNGTRFTNGFCTTASCSASRSVILSGLHNHKNGQYGHVHGYNHFISFPNIQTLPVMMAEAGYRTRCAGKFHVAPEKTYHFHDYTHGPSPEKMAEDCRSFIADDSGDPFFLYFCTHEPHRPFKREGSEKVDPDDVIVPPYLPDIPECREELAKYYMSVERTDKGMVRLEEILKETGHWDDTLIIYISDNGIAFPGAKTNLYEPGMRLPCVVRNPFQENHGVVSDALVSWADITPTVLDFAAATPEKAKFHGRSFLSAVGKEHPDGFDEVYASHQFHEITMYYPMRVLRERRYKLIWNIAHGLSYPFASDLWASETWQGVMRREMKNYGPHTVEDYLHRPEFELYDVQEDTWESNNLADDPKMADELERMKKKIREFQKNTDDPWIVKWEHE